MLIHLIVGYPLPYDEKIMVKLICSLLKDIFRIFKRNESLKTNITGLIIERLKTTVLLGSTQVPLFCT